MSELLVPEEYIILIQTYLEEALKRLQGSPLCEDVKDRIDVMALSQRLFVHALQHGIDLNSPDGRDFSRLAVFRTVRMRQADAARAMSRHLALDEGNLTNLSKEIDSRFRDVEFRIFLESLGKEALHVSELLLSGESWAGVSERLGISRRRLNFIRASIARKLAEFHEK